MSEKTEVCQRFLAAMGKGDYDAQAALMTDDFEITEADSLPYAGTYHGIEGWTQLTKAVIKSWSGLRLDLIEIAGESEDSVLLHFALSGASRKTGRRFGTEVMEHWRFRGGKVAAITPYYFDTAALADADRD